MEKVKARIRANRADIARAKDELDTVIKEIAVYRADPKNKRFSRSEEEEAKRDGVVGARVEGGEWEKCLEKILVAILKVPSTITARRKMEQIATGAIDSRVRGVSTLLEFGTELDKAFKFARWQAKIFLTGEALAEVSIPTFGI